MNDISEPTQNTQEDLGRTGIKAYSTAVRICAIGCISSLILALLAVLALFIEGGDSASPGFFIFGTLAVSILVITGATAIFMSLTGVVNGTATLIQNENLKEESTSGVIKNVSLILGIIFVMIIMFKILRNW